MPWKYLWLSLSLSLTLSGMRNVCIQRVFGVKASAFVWERLEGVNTGGCHEQYSHTVSQVVLVGCERSKKRSCNFGKGKEVENHKARFSGYWTWPVPDLGSSITNWSLPTLARSLPTCWDPRLSPLAIRLSLPAHPSTISLKLALVSCSPAPPHSRLARQPNFTRYKSTQRRILDSTTEQWQSWPPTLSS